ncbi:Protoporphyrinogen oxidase [Blattella germanica]|nr:Protoporphyrinogen oxidase [Blattella germanica]PSN41636.1 Protoporphyrinogen oxidase [Blattella germanica]
MHIVLGGGIGGLSAAYYLLNSGLKNVTVIEASSRIGGWIKSTKSSKGFVFEHGPRTIRPRGVAGENTLQLVEQLGLTNKVMPIPFNHPAAKNRLIYVNKTLHALPSDIFSFLTPQPPFTKPLISALLQDLQTPKKEGKDESIYDFAERRLGKEIAEYAVSPLICGICAGDAKEISVKFLMKSLFEAEQEHGSIVKGMLMNMFKSKSKNTLEIKNELSERSKKEKWSVWSLDGGLELLPETLKVNIEKEGGDILLNSPCEEMIFKSGKVMIKLQDDSFVSDHVFSSLPAAKLAELVSKQHPQLSKDLSAIPTVNVGVVNLQYKGNILKENAFGFLVPTSQKIPILGVVFDSCCFPNGDNTILTVMMGGRWFEQLFGSNPPPERLLSTAVQHVRSILNIPGAPENHYVSVLNNCIPQYVIGHHERVERIKAYICRHNLPLSIVGASYDGVSVNDVILSARTAVESLKQKNKKLN